MNLAPAMRVVLDMGDNIFNYSSTKTYLEDFFSLKKKENSKYSLVFFSRFIKTSDSYLKQVLSGRRSLNMDKARALATVFKLTPLETSYFLTLIMKENAKTKELKNYFDETLEKFKELHSLKYNGDERLKGIFQDSLTWEIYTLIGVNQFKNDPEWIAMTLNRKNIKLSDIKSSLDYLITAGIIEMKDGKIRTKDIVFKDSNSIRDIYRIALKRAIEYLNEGKQLKPNDYFDSFCMILSDTEFQKVKKLLEETKIKMASLIDNSSEKDQICYYNTNLFYASHKLQ